MDNTTSVGSIDELVDPSLVVRPTRHQITGFYGNARSVRQASGELCRQILDTNADFWAFAESHRKDDPINMLTPRGYNIISRRDRSKHGGGILIGAKKHLLCNPLDLEKYNIPNVAEMDGFELTADYYICCYTPLPAYTHLLNDMLIKFILDHPGKRVTIIGDFNAHNKECLHSVVHIGNAGTFTQDLRESFAFNQYVDCPTRGPNTLDLVMSHYTGSAVPMPNLGTSDHVSIKFVCNIADALPSEPDEESVLDWHSAPWNHIRGAVKRSILVWNDCDCESPEEAECQLHRLIHPFIADYVKEKTLKQYSPAPWWN